MARYQQVPANEIADEYWRAGLLWFRLNTIDPTTDTYKCSDWAMLENWRENVMLEVYPSRWRISHYDSRGRMKTVAEYAILVED